jgi:hypothetical protein
MCAGNVACDLRERSIKAAIELEPFVQNQYLLRFAPPAADKAGSKFERWSGAAEFPGVLSQLPDHPFDLAADRTVQAALPPLLQPVSNPATQSRMECALMPPAMLHIDFAATVSIGHPMDEIDTCTMFPEIGCIMEAASLIAIL